MTRSILLIEDEVILAKNICAYLLRYDYEVRTATSAEAGLEQLNSFKPDIVILDINLPGMNGVEALARIKSIDRHIKVIMITAYGSIELAVDTMRDGAYHFLTKPIVLEKLRILLEKSVQDGRRDQTLAYYQNRATGATGTHRVLGNSTAMQTLREKIERILEAEKSLLDSHAPAALVCGETGTGKGLVARALHFNGTRSNMPFVEINCASMQPNLLESELFGHERGAFTDAHEKKIGLFETAEGGTLFLDEIGDMDYALQARVLKVIEEKTIRRLGSAREQQVNVRIVAATHHSLEDMVRDGRFRSDLYFRLRVIQIEVPPLRTREDDVIFLARHFLALHGARYGRADMAFDQSAEMLLRQHRWPGNVRELRNIVEQSVLLASSEMIDAEHLNLCSPLVFPPQEEPASIAYEEAGDFPIEGFQLDAVERNLMLRALDHTRWNVTHAARMLGVSRDTMRYRIDKFGLTPPA
jgi:DNA-binding NtrC family response regulator